FHKASNYDEGDKSSLINWQFNHIGKIIPAYQKKFKEKRIDISFSPFFHPILPLLCNSNSAREALPEIKLPGKPFAHPEDAKAHIKNSIAMFENLFDSKMQGMWPSEGSISDESLKIAFECGIKWSASDEQILFRSLQKNGLDTSENHPYTAYLHSSGIKLFFRDHMLSDKIGFVYSSWDPKRAAEDFISHIKNARSRLPDKNGDIIVPVILDGENSWEFYKNDGLEFLRSLYKSISEDKEIDTVTFSEVAESMTPRPLKSVFSGSWIDHNFRIWIGHQEDNTAWDLLESARNFLAEFQKSRPDFDSKIIESAWREIYVAEGSDWFWWYGDEHRGPDNHLFDKMFRSHLVRVYELLESEIPLNLRLPIISQVYKAPVLQPDSLLTPTIDGKISHFYEWFGAGQFQCQSSDSTMHRVFSLASSVHFSFDHENFYLRMDFANPQKLRSIGNLAFRIKFNVPDEKIINFKASRFPMAFKEDGKYALVLDEVLELAVNRKFLWTDGTGKLAFNVEILEKENILEKWPEEEFINCALPEKNKELFWHQ
ncbi:MAG TPA: glycoside hydrolase family 57 protein, partial [candidate division Zixibacteria bacterium]|nr:glycoside hydrolase family 57 protein [candidate division Zixibacteria bacterium]